MGMRDSDYSDLRGRFERLQGKLHELRKAAREHLNACNDYALAEADYDEACVAKDGHDADSWARKMAAEKIMAAAETRLADLLPAVSTTTEPAP